MSMDRLAIADARGMRVGQVRYLDRNHYEIGSDSRRMHETDFIFLPGSGIGPIHARMRKDRGEEFWTIEPYGSQIVRIGEETLRKGQQQRLLSGRDLWLGHLLLRLDYAPSLARSGSAQGGIRELERYYAVRLLDHEEQQRDLFDQSGADPEQLHSDYLDGLIEEELNQISQAVLDAFCGEALRRLLISGCLMSGEQGDVPLAFSKLNTDQQKDSHDLRYELIVALDLSMDAHRTETDIHRIHNQFETIWKGKAGSVPELLKRDMVRDSLREAVLGQKFRFGPIQFLLDLPTISEIMVCGHEQIYVEKRGQMIETRLSFTSEKELVAIASKIVARDGKHLTLAEPLVDAQITGVGRVNVALSPTSRPGTSITIRKFSKSIMTMEELQQRAMFSPSIGTFIRACVLGRKNIIVSGGTGSGKTTLLNALVDHIPSDERVVAIEDTVELRLDGKNNQDGRNFVGLEARRPNMDGEGEITIRHLLRNALRMRPDRIIVGECRSGETLDMLQAMNTGHEGSMTTAHANTPDDMILRLETMVLQAGEGMPVSAIRQQIAAAIDVIIQVGRVKDPDAEDNKGTMRRVLEIAEVGNYDELTGTIPVHPIFEFVLTGKSQRFQMSGHMPSFFKELEDKEFISVETLFPAETAHA